MRPAIVVVVLATLLSIETWAGGAPAVAHAAALISTSGVAGRSSLVVKIKKKKKKHQGGNGERSCPPGYVVLAEPNKYGSYCEPKEGLPGTPQPAEKCKFPGEVGTPPNCSCPEGTEFVGYKGCVKFQSNSYCSDNNQPGDRLLNSTELMPFRDKCMSQYKGTPSCATFSTEGLGQYRCCCYYKTYQ
jgi:hypothetical protein